MTSWPETEHLLTRPTLSSHLLDTGHSWPQLSDSDQQTSQTNYPLNTHQTTKTLLSLHQSGTLFKYFSRGSLLIICSVSCCLILMKIPASSKLGSLLFLIHLSVLGKRIERQSQVSPDSVSIIKLSLIIITLQQKVFRWQWSLLSLSKCNYFWNKKFWNNCLHLSGAASRGLEKSGQSSKVLKGPWLKLDWCHKSQSSTTNTFHCWQLTAKNKVCCIFCFLSVQSQKLLISSIRNATYLAFTSTNLEYFTLLKQSIDKNILKSRSRILFLLLESRHWCQSVISITCHCSVKHSTFYFDLTQTSLRCTVVKIITVGCHETFYQTSWPINWKGKCNISYIWGMWGNKTLSELRINDAGDWGDIWSDYAEEECVELSMLSGFERLRQCLTYFWTFQFAHCAVISDRKWGRVLSDHHDNVISPPESCGQWWNIFMWDYHWSAEDVNEDTRLMRHWWPQ